MRHHAWSDPVELDTEPPRDLETTSSPPTANAQSGSDVFMRANVTRARAGGHPLRKTLRTSPPTPASSPRNYHRVVAYACDRTERFRSSSSLMPRAACCSTSPPMHSLQPAIERDFHALLATFRWFQGLSAPMRPIGTNPGHHDISSTMPRCMQPKLAPRQPLCNAALRVK